MKTLKNFKIAKSLIGKNVQITFTNKKNVTYTYDHDTVYNAMKTKLDDMNCFIKYKSYTSSNSIPTLAKPFVKIVE